MSKDLLFDISLMAERKGVIDEELLNFLDINFPDKVDKVLKVIKRGITKYTFNPSRRVVWIALGENDEYLLYPKLYCSCQDFYKSVVIQRRRSFCKHLLAQVICEYLPDFKESELEDNGFNEFIEDLDLKF
jgi:predicted nucleic acid-binding Zn finger protein